MLGLRSASSFQNGSSQNVSQQEEDIQRKNERDEAWNAAVHVIAVRHPFELAVSALHYVFQPDRFTMLG